MISDIESMINRYSKISTYGVENCPIDIMWTAMLLDDITIEIDIDGSVELTMGKSRVLIKEIHMAPKYLDRYYNYGRNATIIQGHNDMTVLLDKNGILNILHMHQTPNSSNPQVRSIFAHSPQLGYAIYALQGVGIESQAFVMHGESIYCMSTDGVIVKARLDTRLCDISRVSSYRMWSVSYVFNCLAVCRNMLVVGGFDKNCGRCRLSLLDTDLNLRHTTTFDSHTPCHHMRIEVIDCMPILTIITASMAMISYAIVNSVFVRMHEALHVGC